MLVRIPTEAAIPAVRRRRSDIGAVVRRTVLAVAAGSCLAGAGLAADAPDELAVRRGVYARELSAIRAATARQQQEQVAAYRRRLEALYNDARQRGDLDGVMAVNRERERCEAAGDLPSPPAEGDGPAVRRLREQAGRQRTALLSDEQRAIARLTELYLGVLEELQKRLTRDGRLDEALAVKAERDAVRARPGAAPEAPSPPASPPPAAPERLPAPEAPAAPGTVPPDAATSGPAIRLDALKAVRTEGLRAYDDPPRVGLHAVGPSLRWANAGLRAGGTYEAALTYSAIGREAERKGQARVTVGGLAFTVELGGSVGWGTPRRQKLGTVRGTGGPQPVTVELAAKEPSAPAVCDVWFVEFVPAP